MDNVPAHTAPLLDEEAFVARLREGDDEAFETLVREYGGRMLAVSRRMLNDESDAQDAVQDAFLSAFRSIDSFKGESRLSTWLHRITVNAALMKLRKRRRLRERKIEDLLPVFDSRGHHLRKPRTWGEPSDTLLQRAEVRQMIRAKIDELPDDYRTVLLLRDIEELDTAETAEVLGISTGAVKTRLHRARLALRSLLEGELV